MIEKYHTFLVARTEAQDLKLEKEVFEFIFGLPSWKDIIMMFVVFLFLVFLGIAVFLWINEGYVLKDDVK